VTAPEAQALDTRLSTLDSSPASPDWIFVPTVLVHHLLGWWMLLKTGSVPRKSRVLLFFPNLPIRLDDIGLAHWSGGPTTKLMAWLFGQLRNEVESGRVVLGVETHAMRRALEGLIQMPVVYLPHPVEAQEKTRVERRESRASSPANSNSPLGTSALPIVFGCYGAARWEKGSDIFLKAIRLVLQKAEKLKSLDPRHSALDSSLAATAAGRPLRFAIQWVEDFRDDSGNLVSIDPWLLEHPQVEVIGRFFEGDEYERRLAATDVMVLPYRKPYRLRVSRVVIEAMMNGMPVIATRGTTLFEQAEDYGVVIGCEEGSAESLAEAILKAAENFEMMRVSAMQRSTTAAKSFSVGYFRDLLGRNGQKLSTLDAGPSSLHFK
jgi:glycosyltransferase involved in cell wall biosynthesis